SFREWFGRRWAIARQERILESVQLDGGWRHARSRDTWRADEGSPRRFPRWRGNYRNGADHADVQLEPRFPVDNEKANAGSPARTFERWRDIGPELDSVFCYERVE